VRAQAAPTGYKASEPMLMWEALRQATDEARASVTSAKKRSHAQHTAVALLALTPSWCSRFSSAGAGA